MLNLFSVPPVLAPLESPIYSVVGREVVFPPCHVLGYPPGIISWKKAVGDLPENHRIENNRLILTNVQLKDMGDYVCEGRNRLGVDTAVTNLVVMASVQAPSLKLSPSGTIPAKIGEPQKIVCSHTSFPPPKIKFMKNGNDLSSGGRCYFTLGMAISSCKATKN